MAQARKHIGALYVYGGNGPNVFDCSSLIQWSLKELGYKGNFPRVAVDQMASAIPISRSDLKPGDLIGFHSGITHIGIYSGNNRMIEAPATWVAGPGGSRVRGRVREVTITPDRWAQATRFGRIRGLGPGTGAAGSGVGGIGVGFPGLGDLAKPITSLAESFAAFGKIMDALLLPSTWVRFAAATGGAVMITGGTLFLVRAARHG